MDGEKPIIDPRYRTSSYAESQLVDVIEKCHIYNPQMRPNITGRSSNETQPFWWRLDTMTYSRMSCDESC